MKKDSMENAKKSGKGSGAGQSAASGTGDKKLIIILMAISAVIIAVVLAGFVGEHSGFFWRISDRMSRKKVSLTVVSPVTRATDRDSLAKDERVTFDQSLLLINSDNKIPKGYKFDIVEFGDTDVYMNGCITDAYRALADDMMVKFGKKLYVMSAYRSPEEQEEAIKTEGDKAAAVGESEHQAGLALDVYISMYAGAGFLKSDVGKAVNGECDKYGFIIRYPYWGKKQTGFDYEPWHIRYVGYPHAGIIMSNMLTLEEYVAMLEPYVFYSFGDYIISRQKCDNLAIPAEYESLVISPDNTGYCIITALVGQ